MAGGDEDCLAEARWDLKESKNSLKAGHWELNAFETQQSAESALEGLLRYHKLELRGHTSVELLE